MFTPFEPPTQVWEALQKPCSDVSANLNMALSSSQACFTMQGDTPLDQSIIRAHTFALSSLDSSTGSIRAEATLALRCAF